MNTGAGAWTLFDPSYGVTTPWAGFALPLMAVMPHPVAIPQAYEVAAVQYFPCTATNGFAVFVVNVPSLSPNPPHLAGSVLWNN